MHRFRVPYAVALAGLVLTLSGCGGDDGEPGRQTDWPRGATDLVLRMQTLPGMAPPTGDGPLPDFSVYGDGTVVVPASDDAAATVAHLDEDTVADLLGSAVTLVDDGDATGVAGPDAPVVRLTYIRDGAAAESALDGTAADVADLRQRVLDAMTDAQQ